MSVLRPAVLIVDSRTIVRIGLSRILGAMPDIRRIDAVATWAEAVERLRAGRHEVLIAELGGERDAGLLAGFLESHRAEPKLLLLCEDEQVQRALALVSARIGGCLLDTATSEELQDAVRAVAQGRQYFSDVFAAAIAEQVYLREVFPRRQALSTQEWAVLDLLCRGYRVAQIAEDLHISKTTVNTYKHRIKSKTGFRTLAEMVRFALERRTAEA